MKTAQIVSELIEVSQQLGLNVRIERGNFRGGYCILSEDSIIVLNKRHPPEIHLSVLADILRGKPVDTVYIKPAVRNALQRSWEARESQIDLELPTPE
ncbi:MAG: hypothetical protein HKN43_06130 [Rhodothermales bacterium]|nr:hypothetical protein [Rhodothermales bacterium]